MAIKIAVAALEEKSAFAFAYFFITISIVETLIFSFSTPTSSVSVFMLSILASWTNFFLTIYTTSTALLMALPLALTCIYFCPLLN